MTAPTSPILITGCSAGLGHTIALHLARRGHRIYATARKPETLDRLAAHGCQTLALDVTDEASMTQAVKRVLHDHGRIGALVNNAGYAQTGPVEDLSMAEIRKQFDTNVFGAVRLCQLALPSMRAAGHGRIINIGSLAAHMPLPLWGGYTASKAALAAFTNALRIETAKFNIHATLIEPGYLSTEFTDHVRQNLPATDAGTAYEADLTGLESVLSCIHSRTQGQRTTTAATPAATQCAKVLAALAADPTLVARRVERVLASRRPPARLLVTAHAHAAARLAGLLPQRHWDATVRALFATR
ncbi:SDR family oxidoreductase [Streptomyces sp. MNP-20]|uniref:SDR family oxidoreductase n=1 Tax=Streptomyces sp. MNP-20 TaxID=2721165 RepID=UPI00155567E3|nr:SDR family oxidoreductase [Streptomyces sp. MNP-20]